MGYEGLNRDRGRHVRAGFVPGRVRVGLRRGLLSLLALLVGLPLAGVICQAIAAANDKRTFPPPGQLVAVAEDVVRGDLQNELAALSTNSVHQMVNGAAHGSIILDRQYAQVTSAAILEVITTVQTHQPLPP
jgi:hypothetical protein